MWLLFWIAIFTKTVLIWGDFVPDGFEEVSKRPNEGFGALEKCGEGSQQGKFKCVVYYKCDGETNTIVPEESVNKNGYGLIDIRFGANSCEHPLDVCCKIPPEGDPDSSTSSPNPTPHPIPTSTPNPTTPSTQLSFCGIRNNNGIDFKITGNNDNEAEYGEFPWMVAILKKNYNPAVDPVLAICGGSLIAPRVILTAAHCVHKFKPDEVKVRAGEWDTQTNKERLPYQERDVVNMIIHEKFQSRVLFNDVALLILNRPFKKAEHIGTICLPSQNEITVAKNCMATGWGKNRFGKEGEYQVILKKIQLPVVPFDQCEKDLKETRLGKHFQLDQSFMCAGGEPGKDTCTGDGGSPLVCPDPYNPTRYVQAGIVAWGIGCAEAIPGVYVDVAKFRNWIDAHMERLNLSNKPYTI